MGNGKERNVYILSGPAGVGKTTTSKELVKQFANSAYISGDFISHMHINGRKKPWKSKDEVRLIWDNILSLTRNFVNYGNDVVIDYVTFPEEAKWLYDNLKELNIEVFFVVLWGDEDTLMKRDRMREPNYQMGERCLILANEFIKSEMDEKHLFDTSEKTTQDIPEIVQEITYNPTFKLE